MNRKITALTLGLLLAFVPGVFAQLNAGGTQTYTFPRLTVNPGPFTLTGAFALTGDLTMGSGGQIFLDDGAVGAPALTFTNLNTTGYYLGPATSGSSLAYDATWVVDGEERVAWWKTGGGTRYVDFLNPGSATTAKYGVRFAGGSSSQSIYIAEPGAGSYISTSIDVNTAGNSILQANSTYNRYTMAYTGTAANAVRFETDTLGTNYTDLTASTPSGVNTATLPALTGTVLLGGANNQLGAVTTTINSATQFNIHSDANVTIDGDADNGGGGSVILSADNDAQQVLVGAAAVTVNSDASFTANLDDGASDLTTFFVDPDQVYWEGSDDAGATTIFQHLADAGATALLIQGTDGTDGYAIDATANTILLDADSDNDGDGTVTLDAANSTSQIVLSATSVDINDNSDVTIDADTGTENASLTLDGDGNAATLSVSDGTDTADYRAGQNSITLDADADDDGDGVVTLSAENSTQAITLGSNAVLVQSDQEVSIQYTNSGSVSWLDLIDDEADWSVTDGTDSAQVTVAPSNINLDADTDGAGAIGSITMNTDASTSRFGQADLAWADNVAETLFTFAIADTGLQSGRFRYFSRFNSGGGTLVANVNEVIFACVNESDAEVCDVNAVTTEASAVDGDSGVTMACTAGYSAGANAVSITLTCDTSDSSGGTVDWVLESESLTALSAVGS